MTVRALPGPRSEWLLDGADALGLTEWVVSTHSDRVGVRLDGYPLELWPAAQHGPATGYLPQGLDLLPGTIGDTLALAYTGSPQMNAMVANVWAANKAAEPEGPAPAG